MDKSIRPVSCLIDNPNLLAYADFVLDLHVAGANGCWADTQVMARVAFHKLHRYGELWCYTPASERIE